MVEGLVHPQKQCSQWQFLMVSQGKLVICIVIWQGHCPEKGNCCLFLELDIGGHMWASGDQTFWVQCNTKPIYFHVSVFTRISVNFVTSPALGIRKEFMDIHMQPETIWVCTGYPQRGYMSQKCIWIHVLFISSLWHGYTCWPCCSETLCVFLCIPNYK